ncbi:MAG TPA: SgcJ/EcaC family oxidoreductase [Verrucomicrobiae bacterium]|jgi:uncharacterized protein (TIGR02246 family)|nr:SgcJ/EcaC family oxidoreductase [Verrucomicrobiae bacterium]
MISNRMKTALAIFLFLAFASVGAWAQMGSSMDADSAAIKQSVAAWSAAWNSHDAHATAMKYTEDGDFTNTTGIPSHGWKALEDHYNEIFTTFLKDAHRTDSVRSIRFLNADTASVDIDWQMTGAKTRDGKDVPIRKGLLTWIVTKHNGEWMIAIYHETAF